MTLRWCDIHFALETRDVASRLTSLKGKTNAIEAKVTASGADMATEAHLGSIDKDLEALRFSGHVSSNCSYRGVDSIHLTFQ